MLGTPIAGGNTAEVYLHEGKIIKLFAARLPAGEAAREAGKQRMAHALGIPVPRVLDVTQIQGRQALVMEYIPGPTLGALMVRDMEQAQRHIAHSIALQRTLHKTPASGLESMRDRLRDRLGRAPFADESSRSGLLDALDRAPMDTMLCHGDFHVYNLIQSPAGTVIIDWVDATAGNPHADACRSYVLYLEHTPALAALYLRLYCEAAGCGEDAVLAWKDILTAARRSEHIGD